MSVGKTLNNRGNCKIGSVHSEIEEGQKSDLLENHHNSDLKILEETTSLEDVRLKDVSVDGVKIDNLQLNFSRSKKSNRKVAEAGGGKDFDYVGVGGYDIDQVEQHVINGTFSSVVDTIVQPKFIKEAYEKADVQGKADIKVLAAVAIASHGEKIADGLRKNKTVDEIKEIPEQHIADVMKMSMQFGASSKSMNAFMNILHEAGKLPAVIEHIFKDVKSSDVINITSSIMRLGLDPTPITCAQTVFRIMAYALDHSGVQKTKQPALFKFVSTMARGFQIGSNVLEVAGNASSFGMISGVNSFLIRKVVDYSMRQKVEEKVKYKEEEIQFADAVTRMQKEEFKTPQEREEIVRQRESERDAKRQEVGNKLKQAYQASHQAVQNQDRER